MRGNFCSHLLMQTFFVQLSLFLFLSLSLSRPTYSCSPWHFSQGILTKENTFSMDLPWLNKGFKKCRMWRMLQVSTAFRMKVLIPASLLLVTEIMHKAWKGRVHPCQQWSKHECIAHTWPPECCLCLAAGEGIEIKISHGSPQTLVRLRRDAGREGAEGEGHTCSVWSLKNSACPSPKTERERSLFSGGGLFWNWDNLLGWQILDR